MSNIDQPYTYQIAYNNDYCLPGECEAHQHYILEVLIQSDFNKQLCTCNRMDYRYLNFDTTPWLEVYEKNMYIRVAYDIGGVLSDFLPLDSCKVHFKVDSKFGWNIVSL